MKPYSIGHEILLTRYDNPLVTSTPEEFQALSIVKQNTAIITAASICARDWAQNQKPEKWMRLWGWFIRNADFGQAIYDFLRYRATGSSLPRFSDLSEKGDGRKLGSPILARLLNTAARVKPSAPFDCPLGLAAWVYFSDAEQDGRCEIANSEETRVMDEIERLTAEIEAEHRSKKEAESCPP